MAWNSMRQVGPPSGLQRYASSYDRYGQNTTVVSVIPQTGRDPFPCPVISSCCFHFMDKISPVMVNRPIMTMFRAAGHTICMHGGSYILSILPVFDTLAYHPRLSSDAGLD